MTIVHKFNSLDWWKALSDHLRGASKESGLNAEELQSLFRAMGHLHTGESLLFAGSALLDVEGDIIRELENGHKKMKTRPRISDDGGKSHTATGKEYSQDDSHSKVGNSLFAGAFPRSFAVPNDKGTTGRLFENYFENHPISIWVQTAYQTITSMAPYQGFSQEELRVADYDQGMEGSKSLRKKLRKDREAALAAPSPNAFHFGFPNAGTSAPLLNSQSCARPDHTESGGLRVARIQT